MVRFWLARILLGLRLLAVDVPPSSPQQTEGAIEVFARIGNAADAASCRALRAEVIGIVTRSERQLDAWLDRLHDDRVQSSLRQLAGLRLGQLMWNERRLGCAPSDDYTIAVLRLGSITLADEVPGGYRPSPSRGLKID